jgi:hypothetical protein
MRVSRVNYLERLVISASKLFDRNWRGNLHTTSATSLTATRETTRAAAVLWIGFVERLYHL